MPINLQTYKQRECGKTMHERLEVTLIIPRYLKLETQSRRKKMRKRLKKGGRFM